MLASFVARQADTATSDVIVSLLTPNRVKTRKKTTVQHRYTQAALACSQ